MGGSCLLLSEEFRDHIGAALLGSLVQMGVDVGGGADVGVAQEVGDIDQRHLLVQQNAGEGVAQIVIAEAAQAQLAEQVTVMLRHIIGAQQVPQLISADVIESRNVKVEVLKNA